MYMAYATEKFSVNPLGFIIAPCYIEDNRNPANLKIDRMTIFTIAATYTCVQNIYSIIKCCIKFDVIYVY